MKAMDQTVQNTLIRTQQKIVGHYRELLASQIFPEPERETIRLRLLQAEAQLEELGRSVYIPAIATAA
jgi:hypothetical protein